MRFPLIFLLTFVTANAVGQPSWSIPRKDREILIDGSLEEWAGLDAIQISPEVTGLPSDGDLQAGDVSLQVQALWDHQYLYLAFTWEDNVWDIREISRRDAVWIDQDKKRRDRMLFFDNLKLQIRRSDYDYTLWVSPVSEGNGPFYWYRLLQGYRGIERATAAPMVHSREGDDQVTLEIMLLWKQLRLKPGDPLPVTLLLCDADLPGRLLEAKLDKLKWVAWQGEWRFSP